MEKLAALSPETLVKLIGEGAVLRIQQDKKTGILTALISVLAETDARLAVTTAIDAFPAGPELPTLISQTQLAQRFGEWADADPAGALAWFQERETSGKLKPVSEPGHSRHIDGFKAAMIRALAGNNNPQAIVIFKSTPEPYRESLLSDLMTRSASKLDPSASGMAIRLVPVLREVFPDDDRGLEALGGSLVQGFRGNLAEATLFLNQTDLIDDERDVIIRSVAETALGTSRHPRDPRLEARIDSELAAWLQTSAPRIANEVIEGARTKAVESRSTQADYIITNLRNATNPSDRKLSDDLMNYDFRSHMREALELAGKIQDPELRARTIDFLHTP